MAFSLLSSVGVLVSHPQCGATVSMRHGRPRSALSHKTDVRSYSCAVITCRVLHPSPGPQGPLEGPSTAEPCKPPRNCTQTATLSRISARPPSSCSEYRILLSRHKHGACPALLLAPMENLADRPARIALKESVGGFDEACTEFIRVPGHSDNPRATTRGLTASYHADELGDIPLAAQLMGSNTDLLAAAAARLVAVKGAPRIDLNCGCPANVVTGGGAGSSLLRDPHHLHQVVRSLVAAVGGAVPVTVKMRSGFDDTKLYEDNLLAVQEAGAAFVTVHPRTKRQSYNGRADWSLIRRAKQLLSIPVVGNGDLVSVSSALAMYSETGCDGLMIGRGALQDPLLFRRIKEHFTGQTSCHAHLGDCHSTRQNADCTSSVRTSPETCQHKSFVGAATFEANVRECELVATFLRRYAAYGFDGSINGAAQSLSQAGRIGRLKKVMKYVFSGQPDLRAACCHLLRVQPGQVTTEEYLQQIIQQIELHWQDGGPPEQVLVNHVTMPGRSKAEQTWQPARSTEHLAAACL